MADKKNGGSGIIKYGYVFEDDQSLKVLAEGHGVVVVRRDGGGYVAFGDSHELAIEQEKDVLFKNLAGAEKQYPNQALLVLKENGNLVFLTEKPSQPSILPKAPAKTPEWMLEKRFRFGNVAANRR